jgi:hypothetical protein
MKTSDEKLNQLLNSATRVPPSPTLANRIIAQASLQNMPANEENFIKQLIRNLIFPKPAYALACSMLVGVLLGWQNPDFNMSTMQVSAVDDDISSLFLAEVNFDE